MAIGFLAAVIRKRAAIYPRRDAATSAKLLFPTAPAVRNKQALDVPEPNDNRDLYIAMKAAIIEVVNDPGMHDSTPTKVARAVSAGAIDQETLTDLLDDFRKKDKDGEIKNPGAYFTACAKHLFARHGVEWSPVMRRDERRRCR